MPLNFDPSPYLRVWEQRRQEEQNRPDFNQQFTQPIFQGLQMMAENKRQQQLMDLQKQKYATDQNQVAFENDMLKRKSNYEYGAPIDPNQSVGVQGGQGASRLFSGGQQMPVGQQSSLIEQFNKFKAGGMKPAEARPEFMGALGQDERKEFYKKANPDPTDVINPTVAKSLGLPDDLVAQYPNGIPREVASLSNTFANRQSRNANQSFSNENQLQTKFLNESKDFKETATAYQRILDSSNNPSAAGDLALIFNYMKMLDPGSTVREGEFANAENSGGVDSRLVAQYNKILSGERLAPEMRQDFVARSGSLYKGQEERHRQREDEFTRIAKDYGFEPNRVVINLRTKNSTQSNSQGSGTKQQIGRFIVETE